MKITAKDPKVTPKSRVISMATWEVLSNMSDDSFNGTVVLEIGVGVWTKEKYR